MFVSSSFIATAITIVLFTVAEAAPMMKHGGSHGESIDWDGSMSFDPYERQDSIDMSPLGSPEIQETRAQIKWSGQTPRLERLHHGQLKQLPLKNGQIVRYDDGSVIPTLIGLTRSEGYQLGVDPDLVQYAKKYIQSSPPRQYNTPPRQYNTPPRQYNTPPRQQNIKKEKNSSFCGLSSCFGA